jgi:uncharacterized membrane protein YciS (DUF1049 family)
MTKLILWLIILVIAVAIGPFITIWTLNTLFPALAIPYTLETWLAALFLGGLITTNVTNKK